MDKVFIVMGTTGEYSDHQYWFVAAYPYKSHAQLHAEKAKKWYLENGGDEKLSRYQMNEKANPYDPDMEVDYTGTDWTVIEVPMLKAVP